MDKESCPICHDSGRVSDGYEFIYCDCVFGTLALDKDRAYFDEYIDREIERRRLGE